FVEFIAADENIGQRGVWRIMHPTAEAQLFLVESGEIVTSGVLHRVMVLKISLQNHFSRRLPAPRSSRNLGKQLEGALGGAKVGKTQRAVGAHHTDQRDSVNVMALGNHLGADEQIEFSFTERVKSAFEIFLS